MSTRKNNGTVRLAIIRQNTVAKFLKRCWITLACLIITAAIISSLFRALTPWAKQYKTEVEQHLSTVMGESVTIATMETGWYWFEPVIKLNQVSISDGKKDTIKLSKLLVGINLFSSLWHWQFQPGVLFIDDLHLSLHQNEKGWEIDGIDSYNSPKISWEAAQPVLAWMLAQQKIIIKNLSAHLYMQDGILIPLSELNLQIVNKAGRYTIKGRGNLAQTAATNFQLLAELKIDPYALDKTSGQAFFSIQHLLPAQWQGFVGQSGLQLLDGKGDVQLWADLLKGKVAKVQARLRMHNVAWIDKETQSNEQIKILKANLAWKPTTEGWELASDRIHLRLGDTFWPKNNLMLRYQKTTDTYLLYVKNILLESLLSTAVSWPQALTPMLAMKPHGLFHDTQIQIKQGKLESVLTNFSNLGWPSQTDYPGVDKLSGALHWQPHEGMLQLGGDKTVLTQKNQPSMTLSALSAAINWQTLSDGLRINLDHFIINHRNLLLNLRGVIDKVTATSSGQLNLTGEFSAKNAQRLLPYLPSKYLKPRLNTWLKRDIKRIGKVEGKINVNGALADFPFDKQPGEFSIKSHLTNVDLVFAPKWPVTKNIDAYLQVNKNTLEADIVNASLKDVKTNQVSVLINNLGSDREVLLVHSKMNTSGEKALSYIRSSPLQKKLSALNMLKIRGLLDLDLKLEAPLYPENDRILVLGELQFKNNKVDVHHSMDDVNLEELTGDLRFDQSGVLGSHLQAQILNNPVTLAIQSIHQPVLYTEVKIAGEPNIEVLNNKFNLPILSLMHGTVRIDGVLQLTDDPNDLDHLHVNTSLEGLGIDLPAPLGKTIEKKNPLRVDIDFNPERVVRLRFNYDNQLSSDLWFTRPSGVFELQKGKIRLGGGEAKGRSQSGLQLIGALPNFELDQWLKVKAKLSKLAGQSTLVNSLNLIDVKLQKAKIWKESYDELAVKATKLTSGDWSIRLNHATVNANLRYKPTSNTLTGQFDKLHLENKSAEVKPTEPQTQSTLKPIDMPNLNIRIASFQLGALDLGDVSLKGRSTPDRWHLEYCKITSPSYLLTAKGEWKQVGKTNTTKLEADLHINDLATSLRRWKISPAVEAKHGDLRFQGGWPGALHDFSLAKINGEVAINFKDGRITNLSSQTEEKLGLGKLLSILSLQTIPRRLKLDFSDLAKGGYSFDHLEGSFNVTNGVMTTQDSYIDGPVAYASMKGNLDISKQLYNVDLRISPHITASLPVVATIAGGPVAGFATWVASKIINQGMQKISGYSYKISGPWKQPLVEEVNIIRKRLAAAYAARANHSPSI
ncbi:YhdP family protein [Legionella drozanskii]|uniref:YhdP family protein n=1 Tax=Legionella drozanskii TaxID=96228 RepID=UPI0008026C31|nr:YhdP family protein [Legionella drozanskii]